MEVNRPSSSRISPIQNVRIESSERVLKLLQEKKLGNEPGERGPIAICEDLL
jgi:hypothetical protein